MDTYFSQAAQARVFVGTGILGLYTHVLLFLCFVLGDTCYRQTTLTLGQLVVPF